MHAVRRGDKQRTREQFPEHTLHRLRQPKTSPSHEPAVLPRTKHPRSGERRHKRAPPPMNCGAETLWCFVCLYSQPLVEEQRGSSQPKIMPTIPPCPKWHGVYLPLLFLAQPLGLVTPQLVHPSMQVFVCRVFVWLRVRPRAHPEPYLDWLRRRAAGSPVRCSRAPAQPAHPRGQHQLRLQRRWALRRSPLWPAPWPAVLRKALKAFLEAEPAWHAVIDFVAFGPDDVRRMLPLAAKLGLYVLISTDSVHMACDPAGRLAYHPIDTHPGTHIHV